MYLSCENGIISVNPNKTKFGIVRKEESLTRLMFRMDERCTNYTMLIHEMQDCIGKEKILKGKIGNDFCQLNFNLGWLKATPDCVSKVNAKNKGVMAVYCKEVEIKNVLTGGTKTIQQSLLMYHILAGLIGLSYIYYLMG